MSNNAIHMTSDEVIQTVKQGIAIFLEDDFTLQDLRIYTECARGRRLVVKTFDFKTAEINGFCFELKDVDLIGIRKEMNNFLQVTTEAHEIGHLLANHPKPLDWDLTQFLANPHLLEFALLRSKQIGVSNAMYDAEKEYVAHELESYFIERLKQELFLSPRTDILRDYFGDR